MSLKKEYDDIPGTFVFDGDRSREGYQLNQFCISLRLQKNRDAFNAGEAAYLDKYSMTSEQRDAVLKRDWNELLILGGNIYYTSAVNFETIALLIRWANQFTRRHICLNTHQL